MLYGFENKIRFKTILLSLTLTCSSYVNGKDLINTLTIAMQNNYELKSAESSLTSAEYEKYTSRSGYLPSINLSASTNWNINETEKSGESNDDNQYNNHDVTVRISQTLLDFSTVNDIKKSNHNYTIESLRYKKTQEKIIKEVSEAYIDYLKTMSIKRTTELEVKFAKKRLNGMERSFELGNIAKSILYETEASYYRALNDLTAINKDIDISLDSLFKLVRVQITPSYDISPDAIINPIDDDMQKKLTYTTLNDNLEINIARETLTKTRTEIKQKKSTFLPTLKANITQTFDDSNNETATVGNLNGKSSSLVYSLNLEVPIFNGGNSYYQTKKAYEDASKASHDLDNTINNVRFDLKRIIHDINANAISIGPLKNSIRSNQGAHQGQIKAFQAGTRTITDVLTSEKLLFNSIRDYYDTHYEYFLNLIRLQEVQGDLDLEDISFLSKKMIKLDPGEPLKIPTFTTH